MEASLDLTNRLVCDLELLLNGAFKPLTGFMIEKEYTSVVENMRMPSGELWPMPIVLPIDTETKGRIENETSIVLKNNINLPLARLQIEEIYKPDIEKECREVYKTTDTNHPYVKIVKEYGRDDEDEQDVWYVGGRVEEMKPMPHFDFKENRLLPEEIKKYFEDGGWSTIVGFQTRNPMHRSHYELTKYALKKAGDNARLLIQPIVGVTQECDVDYHTRVKCYRLIMEEYEENQALLSLLPLSMRMAGPREAMWHALIRKNYGCTHFVVGRDHAGPSRKKSDGTSFYGPYDAHELLDKYKKEIGIEIIKSKMIVYVKELEEYRTIDKIPRGMKYLSISGTEQRRRLRTGEDIPEWFSFPKIIRELRQAIVPLNERGICIYLIGLSGSGKTTIANTLKSKLHEMVSRPITILDGDVVRKNLSRGLSFSKKDRSINVRRIGYVASEIVKHRGIVICANIAPYESDRNYNKKKISRYGGYIEVYVNTPLEICELRDVKGLYKLARQGVIKQFTGISDPFEEPQKSDIILKDYMDLEKSIATIIKELEKRGLIGNELKDENNINKQ